MVSDPVLSLAQEYFFIQIFIHISTRTASFWQCVRKLEWYEEKMIPHPNYAELNGLRFYKVLWDILGDCPINLQTLSTFAVCTALCI